MELKTPLHRIGKAHMPIFGSLSCTVLYGQIASFLLKSDLTYM